MLLCAASCDGETKEPTVAPQVKSEKESQSEAPVTSAASPSEKKSVAPASNAKVDEIIADSARDVPSEAPRHGTPDDARLDSLKNSYPSKK